MNDDLGGIVVAKEYHEFRVVSTEWLGHEGGVKMNIGAASCFFLTGYQRLVSYVCERSI